jgi:tetratricopeptide (TPR) repeat protein
MKRHLRATGQFQTDRMKDKQGLWMKLLDRDIERREIDNFIASRCPGMIRLLQLDGPSGVGKTDLLRYALSSQQELAFVFEDDVQYHKCRPGDDNREFSMLSSIVGALSVRQPDAFAGATTDKTRKLPIPPLSQIVLNVVSGLPYVSGGTGVYKAELDELAASKTQLLSIARGTHATRALVDFCVFSITEECISKEILFAIDDVQWVDASSRKVFFALCRKLAKGGFSILILVSSYSNSTDADAPALVDFERSIRDFPEIHHKYCSVDPLSRAATEKVIKQFGKQFSAEMEDFLFEATRGNFSDLMRLLRQRDTKLQVLYDHWMVDNNQHNNPESSQRYGRERLKAEFLQDPILRDVCAILVATNNTISWAEFKLIWPRFAFGDRSASDTGPFIVTDPGWFNDRVEVQRIGQMIIGDQRLLEAARSIFLQDGMLSLNASNIADVYLSDTFTSSLTRAEAAERAAAILVSSLPEAALKILRPHIFGNRQLTRSALYIAAQAYLQLFPASEIEGLCDDDFKTGVRLSKSLHEVADFNTAFQISRRLWPLLERLGHVGSWDFSLNYLKSMREAGQLSSETSDNPAEVAGKIVERAPSSLEKIKALMLSASVSEHLNDFGAIREAFAEAQLVSEHEPDQRLKSQMQIEISRNLGLRKFHGNLVEEYSSALAALDNEVESGEKELHRASLLNHLGLSHFHNGEILDAKKCFSECVGVLGKFGIRMETPLNNLGACAIHQGDLETAYGFIEQARELSLKPAYQTCSIDINFSICAFKLGNKDLALSILKPLGNGERWVPDPDIKSRAQANIGYVQFKSGEFADAARYYAQSAEFSYRFQTEENERLRRCMSRLAAAKAGILMDTDLGDYSQVDLTETRTLPVWRPYQTDCNSLYVI